MARPKKIGLGYFPLDCQMDDKVEMLEAEHGLEGFSIYIKLLQAIYQTEEGELDMAVVFRWKTLGKQYGIPAENLKKIVDTMLTVRLFDPEAFSERQILTSTGIKKRIVRVAGLREKDRSRKAEPIPDNFPEVTQPFSDGKPPEKCIKGKGKGKGKEGKPSSSLRSPSAKIESEAFGLFWQAYPRKEGRAAAVKAFENLTDQERAAAPGAARDWFARRPAADWLGTDGTDYRPHPTTWLNQKRWTDLTEITITNAPQAHEQPTHHPQQHAVNRSGHAFVNDEKRNAGLAMLASIGF